MHTTHACNGILHDTEHQEKQLFSFTQNWIFLAYTTGIAGHHNHSFMHLLLNFCCNFVGVHIVLLYNQGKLENFLIFNLVCLF